MHREELAPILTGWEERQKERQRKIEGGDGDTKNEHRRRRLTRIEATEVLPVAAAPPPTLMLPEAL